MPKFLRKNVDGVMRWMRADGKLAREGCLSRCCNQLHCCDSTVRARYCPDSPNGELQVCCTCGEEYDFRLDWRYFVQDGPLPGAWGNPDSDQSYPCTFGQFGVPPPPPNRILYSVDFIASIQFSVRCVNGVRSVTQTGPALFSRVEKNWVGYPFWPTIDPHYVTTTTNPTTFADVYAALFGDTRRSPCGLGFDFFTSPAIGDFGGMAAMPNQIPALGGGYPWSDCDGMATQDTRSINPCSGPGLHNVGSITWGGTVGCLGGTVNFGGDHTLYTSHGPGVDVAAIGTGALDGSATWSVTNVRPCATDPCADPAPSGACCATTSDPFFPHNCVIRTAADCAFRNGVYHGDGSTCKDANCPKIGACCGSSNQCTQTTGGFCFTSGGTYQGDGTVCTPGLCGGVGGCCFGTVTGTVCEIHNLPNCQARGGVYLRDGTNCLGDPCAPDTTPHGACCIDGGLAGCFEHVTFAGCQAIAAGLGGFHSVNWEDGLICAEIGCLPGPGVVGLA